MKVSKPSRRRARWLPLLHELAGTKFARVQVDHDVASVEGIKTGRMDVAVDIAVRASAGKLDAAKLRRAGENPDRIARLVSAYAADQKSLSELQTEKLRCSVELGLLLAAFTVLLINK